MQGEPDFTWEQEPSASGRSRPRARRLAAAVLADIGSLAVALMLLVILFHATQ